MSNVIQFPGKSAGPKPTAPSKPTAPAAPVKKARFLFGIFAVLLASVFANRMTLTEQSLDLASLESASQGRRIASVGSVALPVERDSAWEMKVAESLASVEIRGPASFNIGRPVTAEEQLQLGILQGKYSLQFSSEAHTIVQIELQGEGVTPAYIPPRDFFKNFGRLIDSQFQDAKRMGEPLRVADRVSESYQILGLDNRPVREAHFELDRFGRLLSLRVDPVSKM